MSSPKFPKVYVTEKRTSWTRFECVRRSYLSNPGPEIDVSEKQPLGPGLNVINEAEAVICTSLPTKNLLDMLISRG